MDLFRTKNNKVLHVDFSIRRYPILDIGYGYYDGCLFNVYITILWFNLAYCDEKNLPF